MSNKHRIKIHHMHRRHTSFATRFCRHLKHNNVQSIAYSRCLFSTNTDGVHDRPLEAAGGPEIDPAATVSPPDLLACTDLSAVNVLAQTSMPLGGSRRPLPLLCPEDRRPTANDNIRHIANCSRNCMFVRHKCLSRMLT